MVTNTKRWAACVLALAVGGLAAQEEPIARKSAMEAIEKSIKWLVSQANEDGTFGKSPTRKMPGVVGLVLHALASSPGKPGLEQAKAMAKAAEYLAGCQQENGAIALKEFGLENYNTSVAIIGLKAYNDPKYNKVLEKARDFVFSCQLTEKNGYNKDEHPRAFGGFGYGNSKRADLSNTQFSLEALKAMGIPEDSPAYKNALLFVKRCQDSKENDLPLMREGANTGGFIYLPGNDDSASEFGTYKTRTGKEVPKPYGNMTYAGIKSLIYCGLSKDSPQLQEAWKWVKNNYSVKDQPGGRGSQGYYYYVVAFAKAFAAAGADELTVADGTKVHWYNDLALHLSTLQDPEGSFANRDARWMESDPILATAYALTALDLCVKSMK